MSSATEINNSSLKKWPVRIFITLLIDLTGMDTFRTNYYCQLDLPKLNLYLHQTCEYREGSYDRDVAGLLCCYEYQTKELKCGQDCIDGINVRGEEITSTPPNTTLYWNWDYTNEFVDGTQSTKNAKLM